MLTAFMWGVLPVFIELCLQVMDSPTITWYRFAFAGIFIFILLSVSRALPPLRRMSSKHMLMLLFAGLALVVNYVTNVEALDYIDPETVQVIMQLAPFMLMLGGIFIYKEHFNKLEMAGAFILLLGLIVFFNDGLSTLFDSANNYSVGVGLVLIAALAWAAYALMQKSLLRALTAKQLTLLIYALGMLVLLPFTQLSSVFELNPLQGFALLFCCINTVVAYGAFTEALHIWNASKVSAVIALAPLFTFLSTHVAEYLLPLQFSAAEFELLSYLGAAMVVIGSIIASLGKKA